MALTDVFRGNRFVRLALIAVVWGLLVYAVEFKFYSRGSIASTAAKPTASKAAPNLGLKAANFACAQISGFVTSVEVVGQPGSFSLSKSKCDSVFNEATTRCPSALPMASFGDGIKCPQPETIHCHGGPLQSIGLFKADSFCGDITDRDLGPPQEAVRVDD